MEGLFDGFNNIYSTKSEWWEEPLTFRQFCHSSDHMAVDLTETQYKWFEDLVGTDPKKMFQGRRLKHIKCILAGKGSGKDLASSMFQNYVFYVLLCMTSPTEYFNLPGIEESIDIVNVAQNESQSIKVFFKRFTDRLKRWPWLKRHYHVSDKGKILNPDLKDPRDVIEVLTATVRTSNGPIRFHALHSAAQGYEGLNILMFTIDEGSAFPTYIQYDKDGKAKERSTADDILDVVKSSSESRNWNWFGVLISYPRSPKCFQMRMYEEGQDPESDIMSSKHAQWECLPPEKYSGEWVEWEGYRIPKERLKTAKKNPADFKLKYMCITTDVVSKFFNKEFVKRIFNPNRNFIGEFVDDIKEVKEMGRTYSYKYLDHWNNIPNVEFVFAGDYSTVSDRTSIMLAHSEKIDQQDPALKGYDKKVVVDLILIWQPDKKKAILVSHGSIRECVAEILYALNIRFAGLDQLESSLALETFTDAKIPNKKHNVNDDDYIRLRTLTEADLIVCPEFPLLEEELLNIQYYPKKGHRGRVDHPTEGSKDVADTLAHVARIIYTEDVTSNVMIETSSNPFSGDKEQPDSVDDWSGLIPGMGIALPNF